MWYDTKITTKVTYQTLTCIGCISTCELSGAVLVQWPFY